MVWICPRESRRSSKTLPLCFYSPAVLPPSGSICMRVELLSHTPDPERLCCAAAKLTHEPEDRDFMEMYSSLSQEHIERVLKYVLEKHHESVVEHASFTFYVEGISRVLTHQLVRHRIASYSQQSQRYVTLKDFSYVTPPTLDEKGIEVFKTSMKNIAEEYERLMESVHAEDARYVLPNACTTKIIITMNARELRHFFSLRLHKTAQWEIKDMAQRMHELCTSVAPLLFRDIKI